MKSLDGAAGGQSGHHLAGIITAAIVFEGV